MAAEWYKKVRRTEFGPVPATEMIEKAADGSITPQTEVRFARVSPARRSPFSRTLAQWATP